MKTITLKILLACTLPLTALNTTLYNMFAAEKPVNKEINFSIVRDSSYSQNAYVQEQASIHVTIYKVNGNKTTKVWERIFDTLPLSQYPLLCGSLSQVVHVNGIKDSKERLVVKYVVAYKAKNNVIEIANDRLVEKGAKNNQLVIEI